MMADARRLLVRLGWRFVSTDQAAALRESPREVILRPRLIEALRRHRFEYRGQWHSLSGSGMEQVVRELQAACRAHSLLEANERLYRLLTLGVTVTEFMPDGRKHTTTVALIDWADPDANLWDLMASPPLTAPDGTPAPSPTLVGWVNGLPLVLVECASSPPCPANEAIERHLRHQRRPDLLPLYAHAHLLLALGHDGARYGTTGTPRRLWARWREPGARVAPLDEGPHLLAALLAPARLLDLLRHFVLFNRRLGKVVARHPQYFSVHAMLARVQQRRPDGAREGGVVWHTTGSGKSLTMVFLTRALMLHPATQACRVLVVTDRVDLEEQLARNFLEGGAFGASPGPAQRKEGERARVRSGRELARRIAHGNERVLFTLVHKFLTAARLPEGYNPSADLVVLVDEGHRTQGGEAHARMRRALPRAAFLAFTGTPLLRHEKTEQRFGPVLHAHTLHQAVDDGMVAPLLYEERLPALAIDDSAVDRWFARTAASLPPAAVAALRRRLARQRHLHGASGRLELIAWDVAEHFHRHFKLPGLGLKGQLATASKRDAIRYQRLLDATGLVRSAVVISPPDEREGEDGEDLGARAEVQRWWAQHAGRQPELRDAQVLRDFAGEGAPDLLIVVDRLLTGFDEPRNAVLYIDKPLSGHNLIQAVARVNRLHDAKAHGLIVDYRGILRALDTALRDYEALEARVPGAGEGADLRGLVCSVHAEVQRLPGLHRALWATLGGRSEPPDLHALLERLRHAPDDAFDAALDAFTRCLQNALASRALYEDPAITAQDIARWKGDARRLRRLQAVRRRAAGLQAGGQVPSRAWQVLLDEAVHGLSVCEPDTLYRVGPPVPRRAPEPAPPPARVAPAQALAAPAPLRHDLVVAATPPDLPASAVLRQALAQHPPRQEPAALPRAAPEGDPRMADALARALAGEPRARQCLDICRRVLGQALIEQVPAETWLRLARTMDQAIDQAAAEHSLVSQNRTAAIRQALLPPLHALLGLERARDVIEQAVRLAP